MAIQLKEKVLKTIRSYGMIAPGRPVLSAVSGGPDSVFLLHVLSQLKRKLRISEIGVCNIDHSLRGEESESDSLFVRNLANKLNLKIFFKKIPQGKLLSKTISVEEAARQERYAFYLESAKKFGSDTIATGHTLDDQAETVLMRIIQGSSMKGLMGIAPIRQEMGVNIIRPICHIEKRSIVEYMRTEGLFYRLDSSNSEPIYFRNVVRSEIVPFLEKYNPKLKTALFNMAEHLREDYEFIKEHKGKVCGIATQFADGKIEIMLKDIKKEPAAIQKEILRDSLERAGGNVKKLSFRHWKEMEYLIEHKGSGSSVDLPGRIRIKKDGRSVSFFRI